MRGPAQFRAARQAESGAADQAGLLSLHRSQHQGHVTAGESYSRQIRLHYALLP
jgi:hypothetical protein